MRRELVIFQFGVEGQRLVRHTFMLEDLDRVEIHTIHEVVEKE
jgi:hypothetical protein